MNSKSTVAGLKQRIDEGSAVVGVVGMGYVGLPLAKAFIDAGLRVIGFDIDQKKVEKILAGQSYIGHIDSKWIARCVAEERLDATAKVERLADADAILICVPTPLSDSRDPDLSYVESTASALAPHLRRGQLVVLESTTYPGTTRNIVLPLLEQSGLKCGEDFFLAYSPEREDPGNQQYAAGAIPKVVGGIDDASLEAAAALYGKAVVSDRTGVQLRSRRGVQDAREHLPRREHRHGQRAEDAVAAARHRRVGSDRRGKDASHSDFRPFIPGPDWADTAFRSIRFI